MLYNAAPVATGVADFSKTQPVGVNVSIAA